MSENNIDNIYCENTITDQEKIQAIRSDIDNWRKNTPGYGFDNFGNSIEIVEVIERPTYVITLETLYEKRQLWKRPFPWVSEEDIIEKGDDIDIWAVRSNISDDFEKVTQEYKIDKSEIIETCIECEGEGIVVCNSCDGEKKLTCSRCEGEGVLKCSSCRGQGIVKCESCRGTGKKKESKYVNGKTVSREVNCKSCLGRGHFKCDKCKDGLIACNKCNKKGEVICSECHGRGIVNCYCCKGNKTVSSYEYVSISHVPDQQIEITHHTSLPPDIAKNISPHNNKELVIYIDTKVNPNNIVFQCNEDIITNICKKMLLSSKEGLDKINHLIKQQLIIRKIPLYFIKYAYSSKSYSLWIYGDNRNVWAPINPISELSDSFYSAAKEAFSKRKRAQALNLANSAFRVNETSDDIIKLKNKIGRSYILSWVLKGFLVTTLPLLLLSLIFVFENDKFSTIFTIIAMFCIIGLVVGGGIGAIIGIIMKNVIIARSNKKAIIKSPHE